MTVKFNIYQDFEAIFLPQNQEPNYRYVAVYWI